MTAEQAQAAAEQLEVLGRGGMTVQRKEKLLAIQKREQMKDVLIERFKQRVINTDHKNATEAEKTQLTEVVKSEVESFLNSASITENNLKKLDKKIRSKTSGSGTASGVGQDNEKYSIVRSSSNSKVGSKQPSHVSGSGVGGEEKQESSLVADWRILDDFALFKEHRSVIEQKIRKHQSGQTVRSALNKQVVELQTARQTERDEDRRWYARALEDVARYEKEEADKADNMRHKCQIEKQMRDEQLELEKKTKMQQKRVDSIAETLTKERIQGEIQAEDDKFARRRRNQREHMANVQAENELDLIKRKEAKERLIEQDRALMQLYNDRMDEEERKRQAEKDARVARNDAAMKRMASTVTAVADQKLKEAEERARNEEKRITETAIQRENDKAQMLKSMRYATKEFHIKQMAERKGNKDEEVAEGRRQLQRTLSEDALYNQNEKDKFSKRRTVEKRNEDELRRMMVEKKLQLKEAEMNANEKKMNRELLKQVNLQLKQAGVPIRPVRSDAELTKNKKVNPEVAIRFNMKVPELGFE